MGQSVGYLVDLYSSSVQFDDATRTTWIHGAPIGKYSHPMYGEVNFDLEKCNRLAQSVRDAVQGKDPDIDYDHKRYSGEAAGWVKGAEVRNDGLWLFVEWTAQAFSKIKTKAYRYFSPELVDEWEHPVSKVKFKDVLLGGGLTNRPYLKGILPINMSELALQEVTPQKEATGMDPKKLRQLLGLEEGATDEQVEAKLAELNKPPEASTTEPVPTPTPAPAPTPAPTPTPSEPTEVTDEEIMDLMREGDLVKLSEKLPWVKSLVETNATLQGQLRMSEIDAQVNAIMAPQSNRVIPESQRETVRGMLLGSPSQQYSDALMPAFDAMRTVQLGEIGSSTPSGYRNVDTNATQRYNDEIAKVMKEDNLDYGSAAERVAALQPQLFAEHRAASIAFEA